MKRNEVIRRDARRAASTAAALTLTFEQCERARYGRDAAFDGIIFIAVKTTRIYCRPVCPVRQPLSANVRYYASAAAAEDDGFRPCLRCRPETAPFSPAWNGTRTTVGRALKLIEAGALDRDDVTSLAARLGVGARHLSRLFHRHLGSSPTRVARTMRVQRAKRLIDGSDLPMTEIALRAGFSSLRNFNASFREIYRCSPSDIRRAKRSGGPCPTLSRRVHRPSRNGAGVRNSSAEVPQAASPRVAAAALRIAAMLAR